MVADTKSVPPSVDFTEVSKTGAFEMSTQLRPMVPAGKISTFYDQ
jgi:hypothetical protein